jgi:hypothetical protein
MVLAEDRSSVPPAFGECAPLPDREVRLHPVAPNKSTIKVINVVGPAGHVRNASDHGRTVEVLQFIGIFRKQYAASGQTDAWHVTKGAHCKGHWIYDDDLVKSLLHPKRLLARRVTTGFNQIAKHYALFNS